MLESKQNLLRKRPIYRNLSSSPCIVSYIVLFPSPPKYLFLPTPECLLVYVLSVFVLSHSCAMKYAFSLCLQIISISRYGSLRISCVCQAECFDLCISHN
jgi:hypothetical protein